MMMVTANLVGFVVGLDGMKHFADELFGTLSGIKSLKLIFDGLTFAAGLQFMVFASVCIFIAVQVMFEYRFVCRVPQAHTY